MIVQERLSNGLMVLVEEIPHLQSAAYTMLVPGGIIADRSSNVGSSLVLAELTSRGAGQFNSRQLSDAFESLGVRHASSAGQSHYVYQGTLMADRVPEALKLLAAMILQPHLAAEEIDNIKSMLFQDMDALHDNPARRVMVELDKNYYPEPYCRPFVGTKEGIDSVDRELLLEEWQRIFQPDGTILSIAGNVQAVDVIEAVKQCFGGWHGVALKPEPLGPSPVQSYHHIQFDSAQLQIALACPSAKFGDPDYYVAKVTNGLLSGGMFGRLFIEVREKRGLCYAVYSRQVANAIYGSSVFYAGTTPERSQETLDLLLEVISSVKGTVTDEEVDRAKTNLKSALIIGEESTAARANSNVSDWWNLKRVRSLQEVLDGVSGVTLGEIDKHVELYAPRTYTLVTLGNRELKVS